MAELHPWLRAEGGEPLVPAVRVIAALACPPAFKPPGINVFTTAEERAKEAYLGVLAGLTGSAPGCVMSGRLPDHGLEQLFSLPLQRSNLIEQELPLPLHVRQFIFRNFEQPLNFGNVFLANADS